MSGTGATTVVLTSANQLDLAKTFACGQCFRWNADEKGVYTGVVRGYAARVWEEDGKVCLRSAAPLTLWQEYFDLDRDYSAISHFDAGDYLTRCVRYGQGIRILRQEPWETLCSFIISQCNNITRIKGIVERLCTLYGEPVELDGRRFYSFPSPERLAALTLEDLAPLRCGYRADYILAAAKAVVAGVPDLEQLINIDSELAKRQLCSLDGVGEKVANCVILFGLHHMEAFPIDVWVRRALKEHFPADFDPASLGQYAGLLQQYIFYYARSGGT